MKSELLINSPHNYYSFQILQTMFNKCKQVYFDLGMEGQKVLEYKIL